MTKVKIVTDSNSGITQAEAKELGIFVLPMPFLINGEEYFEDINLTQDEFYEHLKGDAAVSTSQPAVGSVTEFWDELLSDGSELVTTETWKTKIASGSLPGATFSQCRT